MDINDAWKSTCKVLLGGEIGDLGRYSNYLLRYVETPDQVKSAVSGKPVSASTRNLCKGARFISNDEMGEYSGLAKAARLDLNEIKDLDSIIQALREKFYYSGNIILGNSTGITGSNRCTDAAVVHNSQDVSDRSKFVAFSDIVRNAEYIFGCTLAAEAKFIMSGCESFQDARCFENILTTNSSDCCYVANVHASSNCMFCFNQKSAHYSIGNLQLQKDKYLGLRQKLIEDIRTTFEAKREIPRIVDFISLPHAEAAPPVRRGASRPESVSMPEIEKAFRSTTSIVLGRALENIDAYAEWLARPVPKVKTAKSSISRETVYVAPLKPFLAVRSNLVSFGESLELANSRAPEPALEGLTLENAAEKTGPARYVSLEERYGSKNFNIIDCACYGNNSANAYKCSFAYSTKNAAFSHFPKFSENVLGTSLLFYSKYCIRCHNSIKLNRCFEVDSSHNCSDCYFCHNCENLQECMFCFNSKSLRYAIGNVELGKGEYMRVKKLVLEEMSSKLEKEGALGQDIYNIGCGGK